MIRKNILLTLSLGCINYLIAQDTNADSMQNVQLQEVVVKAFEQNRRLKDVPAAVNYVGQQAMSRFSPSSIVAAVNTTPGVKMEERSPGSYRFNIRGSSLRSPFGVRNVKVYYNDIPYTDPGGHSYLNQLGYYNFNSLEIIKGPGSSLYGAGTGGVMLIESLSPTAVPAFTAEYTGGSFGTHNIHGAITTATDKVVTRTSYQHLQSDGYRNQSELKRDVLSWNGLFHFDEKSNLKASFLYSDLFYETPGGLTLAEYTANPKSARPNAESLKASIAQKTFLAGASYTRQLTSSISNKSTLYGMFTELQNPNLRAYDRSSEPHVGGRSVFSFVKELSGSSLHLNAGAEWQQSFSTASSFKNVAGNADSLRYFDDINNRNSFLFAQASLDIKEWTIVAGASWNQLKIKTQRFNPRALGEQKRNFDNEVAPRLSVLKHFDNLVVYSSVSKGFSPPTTAELLPTGGNINLGLEAEDGTNYDLGLRATLFNKLYIDINSFIYSLKNTIVQRRDALGGDFYINAGSTKQRGIETYISYSLFASSPAIDRSLLWISYTWHHFRYKDFKRVTDDFSGKQLPGIAPHTIATGLDIAFANGLMANLTYSYNDKTALNDANTAFADSYHLLGMRVAYEKDGNKLVTKVFAGAENLLDERYSLGNDINGFGGRYYNAAAGRNWYAGVSFSLLRKK